MSTFIEKFSNHTILIPRLQREYVQGRLEEIISPFLDDLFKSDAELTYIYGYEEKGCFVPIDGQQRLTTLWLLHVYIASKLNRLSELDIKLRFLSREFADDFCKCLCLHLPHLLDSISSHDDLAHEISDSHWFITSWSNSPTVTNMLRTLRYIHQKASQIDLQQFWTTQHLSNTKIIFSYLKMSEKDGLDDDIYVKMNGRGRSLSSFENLKSWMDEHVTSSIKKEWQQNMDNLWTDLFWINRNRNQDMADEIDDEQMYCFCNLSLLFWQLHSEELLDRIEKLKSSKYMYEELLEMLYCEDNKQQPNDVFAKICEKWQRGEMLHLVWLERLDLFPEKLYIFINQSLCHLSYASEKLNALGIFFGSEDSESETALYHLSMTEGSYDRTYPLLYALLAFYKYGLLSMLHWMRFIRNLVLNTTIDAIKIGDVLANIDVFAKSLSSENLYTFLEHLPLDTTKSLLSAFDESQVDEEVKKASGQYTKLRSTMLELENSRFFRGRIRCIFDFLKNQEGYDVMSLENFNDYSLILKTIFITNGGQPINPCLENNDYLLRRTLIFYGEFGLWKKGYWCFCNDTDDWYHYLNQDKSYGPNSNEPIRLTIKDICLPAIRSHRDEPVQKVIESALLNFVETISTRYDVDIEGALGTESRHKLHFIHHKGVWNYMATKVTYWQDNKEYDDFNIFIKRCDGNRSHKINLRTYGIYLDYSKGALHANIDGWDIWAYEEGDSRCCFSFNDENNNLIILSVLHRRRKEDDYAFELYLNENDLSEYSVEQRLDLNIDYFTQHYSDIIERFSIIENKSLGRLESSASFSRTGIIIMVNQLLKYLKSPK